MPIGTHVIVISSFCNHWSIPYMSSRDQLEYIGNNLGNVWFDEVARWNIYFSILILFHAGSSVFHLFFTYPFHPVHQAYTVHRVHSQPSRVIPPREQAYEQPLHQSPRQSGLGRKSTGSLTDLRILGVLNWQEVNCLRVHAARARTNLNLIVDLSKYIWKQYLNSRPLLNLYPLADKRVRERGEVFHPSPLSLSLFPFLLSHLDSWVSRGITWASSNFSQSFLYFCNGYLLPPFTLHDFPSIPSGSLASPCRF